MVYWPEWFATFELPEWNLIDEQYSELFVMFEWPECYFADKQWPEWFATFELPDSSRRSATCGSFDGLACINAAICSSTLAPDTWCGSALSLQL